MWILPTVAQSSDCCWSTLSVSERGVSLSEVWVTERAVVEETCVMEAVRGNWSGWSRDLQPAEGGTLAVVEMNGSVVGATRPAVALRPAPAVVAVASCSKLDSVAVAAAGVVVN